MRRIILSALVALTAFGGVASADRRAPVVRDHRGGVYVQESRPRYVQPRYQYGSRYVQPRYRYSYNHHVRPYGHWVPRPIFVRRPVIAVRYFNYYQRPALIAENYPPMAGYYWVAGHWDWNGYEWIWNAGHYEPDPNYTGTYYNSGYPNGYPDGYPSGYDPSGYDSGYDDGSYYNNYY